MANFKIEVELDWVDEEGNIDSEIQKRVIKDLAKAISEKVNGEKTASIAAQVSAKVDELVNNEFESLLTQPVVQTDRYGDPKKSFESIREMIKNRFDNYLTEEVDSKDGKKWQSNGYGQGMRQTRFEYILGKAFGSELEKKMADLKKKVEKDTETAISAMFEKMTEVLEERVKGHLGDKVAELINLDNILQLSSGKKG